MLYVLENSIEDQVILKGRKGYCISKLYLQFLEEMKGRFDIDFESPYEDKARPIFRKYLNRNRLYGYYVYEAFVEWLVREKRFSLVEFKKVII